MGMVNDGTRYKRTPYSQIGWRAFAGSRRYRHIRMTQLRDRLELLCDRRIATSPFDTVKDVFRQRHPGDDYSRAMDNSERLTACGNTFEIDRVSIREVHLSLRCSPPIFAQRIGQKRARRPPGHPNNVEGDPGDGSRRPPRTRSRDVLRQRGNFGNIPAFS